MADPVWGLLPKAQDDPQTISEAIATAIAAHESDPDAHLGDGQSLEVHRSNDILDHPAGSTLADKWTMSELDVTTYFENLSSFPNYGSVFNEFPGVQIYPVGTGIDDFGSVIVTGEDVSMVFDFAQETLLQFVFRDVDTRHATDILSMLWSPNLENHSGMGLEIVNQVAQFYVGNDDGSSVNYLSWPGYEDDREWCIRLHNVPDEGVVKVYINGELLGTIVPPDPTASNPLYVQMFKRWTGANASALNVRSLYFAQSLI